MSRKLRTEWVFFFFFLVFFPKGKGKGGGKDNGQKGVLLPSFLFALTRHDQAHRIQTLTPFEPDFACGVKFSLLKEMH